MSETHPDFSVICAYAVYFFSLKHEPKDMLHKGLMGTEDSFVDFSLCTAVCVVCMRLCVCICWPASGG